MAPALPTDPIALFLDVDGTLIDLAPRPEAVIVQGSLVAALTRLNERLQGALALVSGRTIVNLDALFAPLRLRAAGVHGAELRLTPTADVEASVVEALPMSVIARLDAIAQTHPGILIENKAYSVALHYRAAPEAGPALLDAIERTIEAADQDLKVLPGHMVFEVKRAGFDKGAAIERFLAEPPFRNRRPIFLGDDITDLPGFATVLAHNGLAYSVSTARPDTSGHFTAPSDVRAWLEALAGS